MELAFFLSPSPMEIMVIAVIALIVLGPSRLPEAARSLGKGLKEMRDSFQGGNDDDDDDDGYERPDEDVHDDDDDDADLQALDDAELKSLDYAGSESLDEDEDEDEDGEPAGRAADVRGD